jgi:hypothetical protein
LLDCSDTRLAAFLTGKGPTSVNLEASAVLNGVQIVAPNVAVTVQPAIVTGPTTSDEGPTYYTEAQTNSAIAAAVAAFSAGLTLNGLLPNGAPLRVTANGALQIFNAAENTFHTLLIDGATPGAEVPKFRPGWSIGFALAGVAAKYRFKNDGTFQLWNATQGKFQTVTITGAAGHEAPQIAAADADTSIPPGNLPGSVATKYRFGFDGQFELWNATRGAWQDLGVLGEVTDEVYRIGAADAFATLMLGSAPLQINGGYRIKGDGTFERWNATTFLWNPLSLSGAAGAEVIVIGAGES